MGVVIFNFLLQLLLTVGIMTIFGLAIWVLHRILYLALGRHGRIFHILTGVIGTPIHELGHALFCILFGHNINGIKLFEPDNKNGVLGYVNHTYNKNNIYHQIGNFFIGFGPIMLGVGVITLLMYLLLPECYQEQANIIQRFEFLNSSVFSSTTIEQFLGILSEIKKAFFSPKYIISFAWWIFFIISASIVLHMKLSLSDAKLSMMGFVFIVLILLITNTILFSIDATGTTAMTTVFFRINILIFPILLFSICLLIIMLIIAMIIKVLRKLLSQK